MKTKSFKIVLAALAMASAIFSVNAGDERPSAATKALSGVASPELPAKAIELVNAAKVEDQAAVTADVVKSAVRLRPTKIGRAHV